MPLPPDIVPLSLPTPFIVGPVNAFLLKRDPLTLVDTGPGTDACYAALVERLAEHGIRVADIRAVLITHGHVDHMGMLARIVAESGAATYAHESVVAHAGEYHKGEHKSRAFLLETFRLFGVPDEILQLTSESRDAVKSMGESARIDHPLVDGATVLGLDVLHVPGHSSSDTLFVDSARNLAFAGDHVLKGVNPTPLIRRDYRTGERVKSMLEYMHSIEITRRLGLRLIYPGHGAPITNPDEIIARIFQRHERRSQQVLDMTRDRAITPHEVSRGMFPSLAAEHTYLGLSTAIGHLDVLESQGFVCAETRNGVYYYSAAV